MDRTHKLGAEHVGQIGRHRRETAAIHRQDDAEGQHEERRIPGMSERGRAGVEHDAEQEESVVGRLAT